MSNVFLLIMDFIPLQYCSCRAVWNNCGAAAVAPIDPSGLHSKEQGVGLLCEALH